MQTPYTTPWASIWPQQRWQVPASTQTKQLTTHNWPHTPGAEETEEEATHTTTVGNITKAKAEETGVAQVLMQAEVQAMAMHRTHPIPQAKKEPKVLITRQTHVATTTGCMENRHGTASTQHHAHGKTTTHQDHRNETMTSLTETPQC